MDCGPLPAPVNGEMAIVNGTVYGAVMIYSCNTGFKMEGKKTRVCQSSGVWSDEEPVCQRKQLGFYNKLMYLHCVVIVRLASH